eukprot:1206187-Amphidinium_carterae.1
MWPVGDSSSELIEVESLKDQLEELVGIPRQLQRLTIDGQQMRDDAEIVEYQFKIGQMRVQHRLELVHTAIESNAGQSTK